MTENWIIEEGVTIINHTKNFSIAVNQEILFLENVLFPIWNEEVPTSSIFRPQEISSKVRPKPSFKAPKETQVSSAGVIKF